MLDYKKTLFALLAVCLLFTGAFVSAADSSSGMSEDEVESLQKATTLEKDKSYKKAAKAYLGVELYATDPMHKANALQKAARNYRLAGLFSDELDCLIRLVKEHMPRIDYGKAVTRIYEIGDEFYNGHKDLFVTWLPFIFGENRTEDAYNAALRFAPCAPQAPGARLRLAILHMEDHQEKKAIGEFQELMRLHPGTKEARHAYIELAALYVHLSSFGDGDCHWANLAAKQLDDFIAQYPEDPEIPWAKVERAKIDGYVIKRMHGLAEYYHRTGQDDVAKRYLSKIIKDYGAREDCVDSEKLLAKIDETYIPPDDKSPRKKKPHIVIRRNTIPLENSSIIVVPENSDGRYLFPVRDLELNKIRDSRHAIPERTINEDDL